MRVSTLLLHSFIFFIKIEQGEAEISGPHSHTTPLRKSSSHSSLPDGHSRNGPALRKSHSESSLLPIGKSFRGHHFYESKVQEILTAHFRKGGLRFATHAVERELKKRVPEFKIADIHTTYMSFSISITKVAVTRFALPKVSLRLVPTDALKLTVKEGDFEVRADWSIIQQQVTMVNAGGQVRLWVKKGESIKIVVTVEETVGKQGQLQTKLAHCDAVIPLDMQLTGYVGTLVTTVRGFITSYLEGVIKSRLCQYVQENIGQAFDRLPRHVAINGQYELGYELRSIVVTQSEIEVKIATTLLDKVKDKHIHRGSKPN